jgi:hypothetical protein
MEFRLALLLLIAFMPLPAHASIMLRLELPELATQADGIVRGRVLKLVSRWDASHSRIFTDATIAVDRAYKGNHAPGEIITVTRIGGSVDGVGMRVIGEATFAEGEETLVFLRRYGMAATPAGYAVLGMAQGKLSIMRNAQGTHVLASPGAAGLSLVAPKSGGRLEKIAPQASVRPLKDVEDLIVTTLRDAGRRVSPASAPHRRVVRQ